MIREAIYSKIENLKVAKIYTNENEKISLIIDSGLMEHASIDEYDKLGIYNTSNGNRFFAYAISGIRGSDCVCFYGNINQLVCKGDIIMVFSYAYISEENIKVHKPKVINIDSDNRICPNY